AIILDPIQQLGETLAAFDGIRAANAGIIIFAEDLEAGALGIALDGGTLPLVGILIGADVCRRRGAQVRNSRCSRLGHASCSQGTGIALARRLGTQEAPPVGSEVHTPLRRGEEGGPLDDQLGRRGCPDRAGKELAAVLAEPQELDRSLPHFSFPSRCLTAYG